MIIEFSKAIRIEAIETEKIEERKETEIVRENGGDFTVQPMEAFPAEERFKSEASAMQVSSWGMRGSGTSRNQPFSLVVRLMMVPLLVSRMGTERGEEENMLTKSPTSPPPLLLPLLQRRLLPLFPRLHENFSQFIWQSYFFINELFTDFNLCDIL